MITGIGVLAAELDILSGLGVIWGSNKDMNEILQDTLAYGLYFCAYVPGW